MNVSRWRNRQTAGTHTSPAQPHLALLHGAMLLSGFGTVFLGPVLPALAAATHTTDSGSGMFFFAQFIGAFFGGVTTSARLWFSLLRGCTAAAVGFMLLSLCVNRHASLGWHIAVLLPLGFGVGQMLTSCNLLASRRFVAHRGAALSLVNFSWSLGAVLAPFLLNGLLHRQPLARVLACASLLFCLLLAASAWNATRRSERCGPLERLEQPCSRLPQTALVYFAALLFTYGGVETCLSGWITTFGQRYSTADAHIAGATAGALSTTALWAGLTAGRALVPLVLRSTGERTLLTASLTVATLLTAALSSSVSGAAMLCICALLGLSLAPWFPLVLAGMLGAGAGAAQVGTIIAVSGIGAAILPSAVGALSRATGSLRLALLVPIVGLIVLLLLSFQRMEPHQPA